MPRFFVEPEAVSEEFITVTESDYNHIRNVLRMRVGDSLTVCDGEGTDYVCEVDAFDAGTCRLRILSRENSAVELPLAITLYQGLPKKDKMELIVQKAVELGAVRIVPVLCKRTVVKIEDKKREERKTERFNAISESAAKQSGRGIVPEVAAPMPFTQAVKNACATCKTVLLPYENALGMKATKEAFAEAIATGSVAVFIGPEGGFEREEVALAEQSGARIISLGRRILRTETAGLTVLSALMLASEEASEGEIE
ncbi:MAG: 16S rRNA (uracil(1498)-N(3))-methyltransferase [Lachnospiraceae bacterium]|nr:16S rRNA (uracil(1498)-N(3))-methyltransferase [Lachnospiraceae bacterium]